MPSLKTGGFAELLSGVVAKARSLSDAAEAVRVALTLDGRLAEDELWVQESVIGSVFSARYRWLDRRAGEIAPFITGTAHVMAESTLRLDPNDPFCWGIRTP